MTRSHSLAYKPSFKLQVYLFCSTSQILPPTNRRHVTVDSTERNGGVLLKWHTEISGWLIFNCSLEGSKQIFSVEDRGAVPRILLEQDPLSFGEEALRHIQISQGACSARVDTAEQSKRLALFDGNAHLEGHICQGTHGYQPIRQLSQMLLTNASRGVMLFREEWRHSR